MTIIQKKACSRQFKHQIVGLDDVVFLEIAGLICKYIMSNLEGKNLKSLSQIGKVA